MAANLDYRTEVTVTLSVTDLERAVAFYRDVLGLEQRLFLPEMNWAELTTPLAGCTIGMGVNPEGQRGGTAISLGVNDIDAAVAELERRGVQFNERMEVPRRSSRCSLTPDGNPLMLAQRLQ
ncbi:MAG: VOC family protein [Hyphomicrobiales bacterium]